MILDLNEAGIGQVRGPSHAHHDWLASTVLDGIREQVIDHLLDREAISVACDGTGRDTDLKDGSGMIGNRRQALRDLLDESAQVDGNEIQMKLPRRGAGDFQQGRRAFDVLLDQPLDPLQAFVHLDDERILVVAAPLQHAPQQLNAAADRGHRIA